MRARGIAVGLAALLLCAVPVTPAAATQGPPGHPEWWFDTWHVQHLWAEGARGQGILIGEIDTGVNAVPALSGHVLTGTDLGSPGGAGDRDLDSDLFGHGTAMASLMVSHDSVFGILGIAPDARVLPIAVPLGGTTDDQGGDADPRLPQAIRYAADHGARIISLSLESDTDGDADNLSCPADEQHAVDHALAKGAIVVAAGGNEGDHGSPIVEPGVCLGVVSVGAVDSAGRVPAFSSRHPYLTVTAPGVNIPTMGRQPDTAFAGDGTSQATALTSAGLAMIWSKYPRLTNRQVVARLLATLRGRRATQDLARGYGSIDIGAAVDDHVPADAPDPVFAAVDPFLARDREQTVPPSEPPVPPAGPLPAGQRIAVAQPAGPLVSGSGLAGLVTGAVGLVAIVVLVVFALTGRRRRARAIRGFSSSVHPDGPGSAR